MTGIALIAFQQYHIAFDLAGEGGITKQHSGNAFDLVAAFFVVDHGLAGSLQNAGNHFHGGSLAVGSGNGYDVFGKLQSGQNVRTQLQRDLSG